MNFKLRKLKIFDSQKMFEWMNDKDVTNNFSNKFDSPNIDNCIDFINNCISDDNNIHLAITDESNEYYGTVSLKNIKNSYAEFSIVVRSVAMGKGYASYAINKIIDKGFNELNLNTIYWSVKKENYRAIKFYNKNGYNMFNILDNKNIMNHAMGVGYKHPDFLNLLWYKVEKFEYNNFDN